MRNQTMERWKSQAREATYTVAQSRNVAYTCFASTCVNLRQPPLYYGLITAKDDFCYIVQNWGWNQEHEGMLRNIFLDYKRFVKAAIRATALN